MNKIRDFTNHLNAMIEDEETVKELKELYPRQCDYLDSKYHDDTYTEYYLCLVHLCKYFECEKFIMGGYTLSLNPELKAG